MTCNTQGQWGACSIQPAASGADTCAVGNDDNCNGIVNEGCTCVNGSNGTCGAQLGAVGTCAAGMTTCAGGRWGACSIQPAPADTCASGNDNNCNGKPNEGCTCGGFIMPNPASSSLPNSTSYDTSTAGIVVDRVSGLQWERIMTGHTASTGCTVNATGVLSCSMQGAANTCIASRLGGYSDWHLPSVLELVSIVDFTVSPAIDAQAFPDAVTGDYWTTSEWNVGLSGSTWISDAPVAPRVRCVRSGGQLSRCWTPGSHYQVKTGGIIDDLATGLTWQQAASPTGLTWNEAQAFCLNLAGGFRAPSYKELQTIVEYGPPSEPRIDATAFPGTAASNFWTSTPSLSNPLNAWTVSFNYMAVGRALNNSTGQNVRTDLYPVRCVR